jgi:hypothetical protein
MTDEYTIDDAGIDGPKDEPKTEAEDIDIKKKILREMLEKIPDRIGTCVLPIIIAPMSINILFQDDAESRYRMKFLIENAQQSAAELSKACQQALKELSETPKV